MRSLTVDMIADALQLYNNNEVQMVMTIHGDKAYYRSTMAHLSDIQKSVPMHQRFSGKTTGRKRRVPGNPVRDYFLQSDNQHIEVINNELAELEEKDKKQKVRDMQQKDREQSKLHLNYIVRSVHCQSLTRS